MRSLVLCLIALSVLTVNAQNINVRGVVTDTKSGKVLPNATVTLLHQLLKDTTAVNTGAYAITKGTISVMPDIKIQNGSKISLVRGVLELNLTTQAQVKIETFNVKGDLLKKELLPAASAGIHNFNIADNNRATNILIVKVTIGDQTTTFRYLPEHNNSFAINAFVENNTAANKLAKTAAAISDTLHFTANGYLTKMIPISSYDTIVNITLDSLYPGPSIGCGKSLGSLKTGTYKITSSGLSREYIIDIPANYNPNHPYRLIFGMHCMFSRDTTVANEKYYQLKRYADSTQNYCIFVAPNGVISTSGAYIGDPMWNMGDTDHVFVDDMLKLFKGELCVDTNRIFCSGFSFGAMFTYSLSTDKQKQFRAFACFAPANWNIWLPTDKHLPVAYMSTTGMDDPNCPLVHDSTLQLGGRYCALGHAKDNGCIIPATLPTTTSLSTTHLIYDFLGGLFPVKFCTFDGKHQCYVVDGTSGTDNMTKSWIPGETWKFFTQF